MVVPPVDDRDVEGAFRKALGGGEAAEACADDYDAGTLGLRGDLFHGLTSVRLLEHWRRQSTLPSRLRVAPERGYRAMRISGFVSSAATTRERHPRPQGGRATFDPHRRTLRGENVEGGCPLKISSVSGFDSRPLWLVLSFRHEPIRSRRASEPPAIDSIA